VVRCVVPEQLAEKVWLWIHTKQDSMGSYRPRLFSPRLFAFWKIISASWKNWSGLGKIILVSEPQFSTQHNSLNFRATELILVPLKSSWRELFETPLDFYHISNGSKVMDIAVSRCYLLLALAMSILGIQQSKFYCQQQQQQQQQQC